jgi:hypothetical protein
MPCLRQVFAATVERARVERNEMFAVLVDVALKAIVARLMSVAVLMPACSSGSDDSADIPAARPAVPYG